ncbi:leukocyte elastase inhibitor [Asbolus verrucosus]|uniref:Leukocyte elastase inhibitor n=1 Tax=Asbolus verrucosus TaxID=1661398 RepID=A0A482W381_ASBVE|nr:leukocyte elastase inhibitor [Asbolus verrucosus]
MLNYSLQIHNEDNDNNIAISPYGAVSVLVALGEGLRGSALYEIQRAANIPSDISVIRIGLRDIHRHLKSYFIPEEGFLSGLTLSHDNVTLNREYEDILKFYGYDINSFNNALYPELFTTERSTAATEITTETTTNTESVSEKEGKSEMTTEITTTENERSTKSEPTTLLLSSTTEGVTVMSTSTTSLPESTTVQSTTTTQKEKSTAMNIITTTEMLTSTTEAEKSTTKTPEVITETTTLVTTARSTRETENNTVNIITTTEMLSTATEAEKSTTKTPETTTETTTLMTTARSTRETEISISTTTETTTEAEKSTTKTPETETATATSTKETESTTEISTLPTSEATENLISSTITESASTEETESSSEITSTTTFNNDSESTTFIIEDFGSNENKEASGRSTRSVVDYIIARYYDDHFLTQRPPPYHSEQELYFLVNGKHKEFNINYMTYDTVLPFYYLTHLKASALRFPLDSTKYYLLLLLPDNAEDIDKLICNLRLSTSLKYIIDNLRYTHVKAIIPSFMLKGYVILTPTFQKMGIRQVFEPRQADFSPMTDDRSVYVTNIEQAITVNIRNYVDPATMNSNRYLHQNDPVVFKADHPFLYFVIDSEIDVTLMEGKVLNPLNSRIR